jgi:hypothetical protein
VINAFGFAFKTGCDIGPVAYSVDPRWIDFNASVPKHEAQKQPERHTEDTLGCIEFPLEFS